jgi:hypothetical protein
MPVPQKWPPYPPSWPQHPCPPRTAPKTSTPGSKPHPTPTRTASAAQPLTTHSAPSPSPSSSSVSADDAARWATRILESGLVGAIGHALITERISACYSIRTGVGFYKLGSRKRKAAFSAILAAEHWWRLEKSLQAEKCLDTALRLYDVHVETNVAGKDGTRLFTQDMQRFVDDLRQQILGLRLANQGYGTEHEAQGDEDDLQSPDVEEATETLDTSPRLHRKSLIGAAAPSIDIGPLSPSLERAKEQVDSKGEGFE